MIAAILALMFCLQVVYRFIIQGGICRKFINLFYIAAIPLLVSNIAFCIVIFIDIPENFPIESAKSSIPVQPWAIANSIHTFFYFCLPMVMISAILQIATALKMQYLYNIDRYDMALLSKA